MSVICGVIHLDQNQVLDEHKEKMIDVIKELPIDDFNTLSDHNVFMCCGIQYVTKSSKHDNGLKYDKDKEIYYVADCILDNRKELLELLSISGDAVSDSDLLYRAYTRWKDQLGEYVCGIFSFVVYEKNHNNIELYTDQTGSRCLYVRKENNSVYFSTLLQPIITTCTSDKRKISTRFIVGCLATLSPDMYIIPALTPFEGVYQVLAGHYVKIQKDVYEQITYWTPFRKRKNYAKLKGKEAKDAFLNLFYTCVESVLQSEGKTGITLSSGLDSSSIACLATQLLQQRNEFLYSFTSIPMKDYENQCDDYYIVDESFGPKEIQKLYPNLIPFFISCEGKDAFLNMEQVVHDMEVPYKSGQSMVWLNEIYQRAQEIGVTLMLKGQYGNSTISYGNILTLINKKCHGFHFITATREFKKFAKRNHIGKKAALRGCVTALFGKLHKHNDVMSQTLLKENLLKESGIKSTIRQIVRSSGGTIMDSTKERRQFLYYLQGLSQLGAYDTRFGLLNKMVIRDPAKDKRMLEFCASIPMDCFVHDGIERAMVRDYMQGIVPSKLLTDYAHRGLQCADFSQRVEKNWSSTYEKVMPMFSDSKILYYCDAKKLEQLKNSLTKDKIPESQDVLIQVMHLYSVFLFLQQFQ